MCCFELHFHRTVFWVVTALWPEVLLLLEHSYSVTAARSSASPTLEKGKIIIDFFLTLPKLVWTRNALGGCWPLLSKCRIRLVTRKKQQQSWCIAHTFKTRRVVSPTSILKTTMLPDPPLSQIIQLYEQLGGSCSSLPDAPVEFEVPKKKKKQWTSEMKPLRVSLCGTFEIVVHAKVLEEFCRNRFLQISVAKKGHHDKLIWHQITNNPIMCIKHFARFKVDKKLLMYLKQNCSIFSCMHVHTHVPESIKRHNLVPYSFTLWQAKHTLTLVLSAGKTVYQKLLLLCCSYQPTIQSQAKNLPSSGTKEAHQNLQ